SGPDGPAGPGTPDPTAKGTQPPAAVGLATTGGAAPWGALLAGALTLVAGGAAWLLARRRTARSGSPLDA
ncbi:LPXTG cell wall anchor domain-containing protein, partial [Leucobacter sp. M11]|uniref:LPXTG cell wall anchor domain-containing protein n=1 Tax=Leucobacter sp. M11 TaxID=2993565 RepID=UPI002D7EE26E